MQDHNLTEEEITQAASLLSRLKPGYLPQQLFNQINRLHVTSTLVIVPLRRGPHGLEVLLVQRDAVDPVWPRFWHLPGTMLRPNDHEGDYRDAFRRILIKELQTIATKSQPTFVRLAFTQTRRGRELTQIYWVEVTGEPTEGHFFPVSQLPIPHIEHEPPYIQEAAEKAADLFGLKHGL